MNDLDATLRQLYGTRGMALEPASLRRSVLAIPTTMATRRRWLGAPRRRRDEAIRGRLAFVVAGLSVVLVGGILAVTGILGTTDVPSTAEPGAAEPSSVGSAPTRTELVAAIPPGRDPHALMVDAAGRAYYIDRAAGAVVMVDLDGYERAIAIRGKPWGKATLGEPTLLLDGGYEVVIVDDQGAVWAWRPNAGLGDVVPRGIYDPETDLVAGPVIVVGDPPLVTSVRTGPESYDLLAVDETGSRLVRYEASLRNGILTPPSDLVRGNDDTVPGLRDLYAAGPDDLYGITDASLVHYSIGAADGGRTVAPLDAAGGYRFVGDSSDDGRLYFFDTASMGLLVVDATDGERLESWDLGIGREATDVRGVTVRRTAGEDPLATWITGDGIHSGVLVMERAPEDSMIATTSPSATLEPGSVTAAPETAAKPIVWETPSIRLEADAVRLRADGKTFRGVPSPITESDVQKSERTLEVTWREKGLDQRIFFYITADDTHWWVTEVWTYDGTREDPGWIRYLDLAHRTRTPRGETFTGDLVLRDGQPDHPGVRDAASLRFDGLRLTAFAPGTGPAAAPQPGCIELTDDVDYDALVAPIMSMTPAQAKAYLKASGYCHEFSWQRVYRRKARGGMEARIERWCTAPPEGTISGIWGGGTNVRVWVTVDRIGEKPREQPPAGWGCATD